jgi:hypothetical protein
MDDVGRLLWWIFGRFVGAKDEPEPASQSPADSAFETPAPAE